jgi:hypothetical protein
MDNQNTSDSKNNTLVNATPSKVRALTPRAKAFLQHIADGRPTLEAYKLAGYKGENHAAYQLRCELKQHLATLLEQGGFSREQLAVEMNRLNTLPLDPAIKNVNFKQKMDVLRLMEKALPKSLTPSEKPNITPVRLTFHSPNEPKLKSIDAEVVNETDEE